MILSKKTKVDRWGKMTIPAEYREEIGIKLEETQLIISCDTDMNKIEIKVVE